MFFDRPTAEHKFCGKVSEFQRFSHRGYMFGCPRCIHDVKERSTRSLKWLGSLTWNVEPVHDLERNTWREREAFVNGHTYGCCTDGIRSAAFPWMFHSFSPRTGSVLFSCVVVTHGTWNLDSRFARSECARSFLGRAEFVL